MLRAMNVLIIGVLVVAIGESMDPAVYTDVLVMSRTVDGCPSCLDDVLHSFELFSNYMSSENFTSIVIGDWTVVDESSGTKQRKITANQKEVSRFGYTAKPQSQATHRSYRRADDGALIVSAESVIRNLPLSNHERFLVVTSEFVITPSPTNCRQSLIVITITVAYTIDQWWMRPFVKVFAMPYTAEETHAPARCQASISSAKSWT